LAKSLPHIIAGIRLHIKEFFLKVTGKYYKFRYCLSFPTIPDGLRAEKCIKGFKAVSVPIPDEIFEGCGVGILVNEDELEVLLKELEVRSIPISGVFERCEDGFKEVKR
jgi:hypothetical protein